MGERGIGRMIYGCTGKKQAKYIVMAKAAFIGPKQVRAWKQLRDVSTEATRVRRMPVFGSFA